VTDGPYVDKDEDPDRVSAAISTMIWKHMGGSVQLIAQPRFNDGFAFSLEALPPAGDYVDYQVDGKDEIGLSLERLGARCKAFMKARVTRRVLLHGPPGTGKSTLAHRLASNMGNRVLRVDPRAFAKASQKNLTALVNVLRPNVFLLDDIDRRPGEAMELLSYFDDLKLDVIVVGTVNTLSTLDPALLRPGRFDEVLHVTEPPRSHRRQIIQYYCTKFDVPFKGSMVTAMDGFSPADIQEVIRVASVVDLSVLEVEIERVRNQRELYAGDACGEFLTKSKTWDKTSEAPSALTSIDSDASVGDNPDCPDHGDCDVCTHRDYC
jgi:GTPase SAR1 family protein